MEGVDDTALLKGFNGDYFYSKGDLKQNSYYTTNHIDLLKYKALKGSKLVECTVPGGYSRYHCDLLR